MERQATFQEASPNPSAAKPWQTLEVLRSITISLTKTSYQLPNFLANKTTPRHLAHAATRWTVPSRVARHAISS
jgi:hypothetical protein